MSETQQTTQDSAGITRNEDGSIASPKATEDGTQKDQSQVTKNSDSTKQDSTQKNDNTKTSDDDKSLVTKDDKKDEPAGAPEKYEPFKAPEGFEIAEEMSAEIGTLFKKHNLSQAAGQDLVDFYTKQVIESVDGPVKLWQDMQTTWKDEVVKSDLGNGKDDLKPEVKANVAKVINSLGDAKAISEFKEAMDLTGAGNNPAFIRAMNKLASFVTEGTRVPEGKPSPLGTQKPGAPTGPSASAMYPHLAQRG